MTEEKMRRHEKILIVDDEEDICFLLKSILRRNFLDITIDIAHSVTRGIELINKQKYDAYLFDLRLDDGTGFDLIAETKLQYPNPEIVVISAYSSAEDMRRLQNHGVFKFVQKPISKEKLIAKLENVLS